jgi:GNAT superfamily N-acetyltransferase
MGSNPKPRRKATRGRRLARARPGKGLRLRRALSGADFEAISSLDRVCFRSDEPIEVPGPTLWWVAEALGKNRGGRGGRRWEIVAYAGLYVCRQPQNLGMGFLNRVAVTPDFRGQGIQKRLIRCRLRGAWDLGVREVVTYTVPWNPASGNSLLSCGFRLYRPEYRWGGAGSVYFRVRNPRLR